MSKTKATITANGVTADMDDVEASSKVIEGVVRRAMGIDDSGERQEEMFAYESRKIYKAVVEYIVAGDKERTTLYCWTTSFEQARAAVIQSPYMKERNAHIVSIAETPGVWLQ